MAEKIIDAESVAEMLEVFMDKDTDKLLENIAELFGALALSIDKNTIEIAEKAMDALNASRDFEPVTLTGLIKALKDENVQKALGFLVKFAKEFGKRI